MVRGGRSWGVGCGRRGIILPVVLLMIGLLALTMMGFIFFVRAETSGTIAHSDAQQARLAAESGLEELVAVLRVEKHNSAAWFDNPTRFRHQLVWSPRYDRESDPVRELGSRKELFEADVPPAVAWRYSLVAPNVDGLPDTMRYGVTPEASKLNLNVATDEQITQLLTPLLEGLQLENVQDLVNALLDWRDADNEPRPGGAEDEYYATLEPPYQTKKIGRFDTLEELLLVKGWSAALLYGEDVNRNGILDLNEDDGDESEPYYDNADGELNYGAAPFVTIWSRETDTALDNQQRINLNGDAGAIATLMAQYFDEGQVGEASLAFIQDLKTQNFNFSQVASPAELYRGTELGLSGEGADAGFLANSPITLEELPYIMDRFSVRPLSEQGATIIEGLINVNTAPARVLLTVPGMDEESAATIVAMRTGLEPEALATTAWPLVAGAVDLETFYAIAPYLTTKSQQFHVEILGYADHVHMFWRQEWILEMVGPLAQIRYWRDLTQLGRAWPVDDDTMLLSGSQ